MVLKYLSWMLTVGTTFVGTWFFEYTTTDKETGRRKLTVWGRRGIVFSGLALACSLALTLWTDHEAAHKQKRAEEKAAEEQIKLDVRLDDIQRFMEVTSTATLSRENKATLGRLQGIEDYRKQFPDLYNKFINATSFAEVSAAINDDLDRAAASRISNRPECAGFPRLIKQEIAGGPPVGQFKLGKTAVLSFMIRSDDVKFGFSECSSSNSLSHGNYTFLFEDGSESSELQCTVLKTSMSCEDTTANAGARAVYNELQKKAVVAIKTDARRYNVSESTAKEMRTTFSCISP